MPITDDSTLSYHLHEVPIPGEVNGPIENYERVSMHNRFCSHERTLSGAGFNEWRMPRVKSSPESVREWLQIGYAWKRAHNFISYTQFKHLLGQKRLRYRPPDAILSTDDE